MRRQSQSLAEHLGHSRKLLIVSVQLDHATLALLEFFYGSRLGPRTNAFRVGIRERVLQVGDLCAKSCDFEVAGLCLRLCVLHFTIKPHLLQSGNVLQSSVYKLFWQRV